MIKRIKRKKYKDIRKFILIELLKGPKDINQLSKATDINWRTIRNHLIYLKGLDLAYEKFRHKQLRIFDITKEGKEYLK